MSILSPIRLTPQQEELCKRLDFLNQRTIQGFEFSKMFVGAIFAIREENRSNPDWMAQSAHSLREILYQFAAPQNKINWVDAFNKFGSVNTSDKSFKENLGKVYNKITDVAHHKNDLSIEQYNKLIYDYEIVLLWALARQIDIHGEIDKFLSENKPE